MTKKECCSKCGFPIEIPREPVFIVDNIINLMDVEENTCKECGHQKDGSTIPATHKLIQRIVNKHIDQRERLVRFVKHWFYLTSEGRKEVCVMLPQFMRKDYKSTGDYSKNDIEEPYSWNVVLMEVIHKTKLSDAMLKSIKWEDIQDD